MQRRKCSGGMQSGRSYCNAIPMDDAMAAREHVDGTCVEERILPDRIWAWLQHLLFMR